MKASLLVTVLLAVASVSGCAEKRGSATADRRVSSEALRKPPLLVALASRYPDAMRQVSARLVEEGEDPSEFYAEVEKRDGGASLEFRLIHKDTFLPKNQNIVGNPSGKDRGIVFDTQTGKASRSLFYQ